MLTDVFYFGDKPNAHPREKFAKNYDDARQQSTTSHFWIINEYCDYTGFDWDFDFEFLPDEDVWAEDHINVWPSIHQKDSGTWLCNTDNDTPLTIYRADVEPIKRKRVISKNWVLLDKVDETKFDFSWHPDPTDPPYIYKWGCKYYPVEFKSVLEHHVPGATEIKYMKGIVELLPEWDRWIIHQDIIKEDFDFSWRPDPREPNYIFVFGNTLYDPVTMPTVEYRTPDAKTIKYVDYIKAKLKQNPNLFEHLENSTLTDYSWRPDPNSPPYIYVWGNQWNKPEDKISVQFVVPGATEYKYMQELAIRKPCMDNWVVPENIDTTGFDFSWEPSPADPPFIYEFGTQHQKTGGPRYVVEGATEYKYIDFQKVKALPTSDNWVVPTNINIDKFDFSWHPDSTDPLYVYQFGTQWALSGGPKYIIPGATEIKYMDNMVAIALPNKDNWIVPDFVDPDNFDYSWHPYSEDEPYIYQFGTQWHDRGGPVYVPKEANKDTPIKYIDTRIIKATLGENKKNWDIPDNIDVTNFDFSWVPHPNDPPYIYEFGTQWQKTGGPKYVTPDAVNTKYIDSQKAKALPNKENWLMPSIIEIVDFDYSWHPDATEDSYIYVFPTQWQLTAGPRYIVPGATEVKYLDYPIATAGVNMDNWVIPENTNIEYFDFSWHPHPDDPLFIYEFGTQWHDLGGPRYIPPEADQNTPVKYIDTRIIKATLGPSKKNWVITQPINEDKFDFSWIPHPKDPPYIYRWGNKYVSNKFKPTIEYVVPGAIDIKYMDNSVEVIPEWDRWEIPENVDTTGFDFSWRPDPLEANLIWQFGTQWQKTGGPRYIVPGGTEVKYIDTMKVKNLPSMKYWTNPYKSDVSNFDFSWHPDDTAPPYIYQFGTLADDNDGPRYMTPNATGDVVHLPRVHIELQQETNNAIEKLVVQKYYIETTLEDLIQQHPNKIFWALNPDIDYSNFNFDWRPSIEQARYVHAFGSIDNINTQTYFVSGTMWHQGYRDINYVDEKVDFKFNIDMFFVDKGNQESNSRFEKLKDKFGNKIQKTRYLNSWVDTINRCINRSSSNLCWVLNSELDYTDFDFNYYPNPWQMKMVHVFGTQWSHWGTTFLINRETFPNDTKYIKIIEHLSNLNFVKEENRKAKATHCLYDLFMIDYGNKEIFKTFRTVQSKVNDRSITTIEYKENYLDTFKEILKQLPEKKEHYIWICSSICDYSKFDFTYICDPFAREQLHVFPSSTQKYGDTFLVNVNKLRELIDIMENLQDYDKINFNRHMTTERYPAPEILSNSDTHTLSLDIDFNYPYAVLVSEDNKDIEKIAYEPLNLWSTDTKNIVITSTGGTRIVIPKEAKDIVKRELYDYPYIVKSNRLAKSKPLDIVFLSNGEPGADENYEHLLNVTKGLDNRVVRVDGVNGRVNSYHAAANASETPWMFTVFAKLKVSNKFDWNWQPDRLQVPKHYVFHAKNPVNGLVYGHQAMIAYNKKITLNNEGRGLDFTQDDEHEVLDILSGVANFNTDSWTTWRTSFREALKLCTYPDKVSQERLKVWTTVAEGDYAQDCLNGANDAIEYFDEVAGDYDLLRLSYDWAWLREYYNKKYGS